MSHDDGSSKVRGGGAAGDTRHDEEGISLNDTTPGVIPDMELSKTLPTGAAFHATWRIPNLSDASSRDPGQESGVHAVERSSASGFEFLADSSGPSATRAMADSHSRASDAAKRATTPMKFSVPPNGHSTDALQGDSAYLGTTRREFNQPKLSPREKAKRNMLTHTLQMPLVLSPLPPSAAKPASAARSPSAGRTSDPELRLHATQRQGTLPMPLPGAWSSVHRVGAGAPSEGASTRPAAYRSTDPMPGSSRRDSRPDEVRAEPVRLHSHLQGPRDSLPYPRPSSAPPQAMPDNSRWTQLRTGDYERVTMPGDAVRIPELSGREWLFIGLLACASAATLYSLMVDDMTTAAEEESVEAATEPQHLVRPALPNAAQAATAVAVVNNTTEIISEPSSAEIVVGGAVIGNTPAKVTRGDENLDYLLRKQGYEPQIVRVSPQSPTSITITLQPK